MQGVILAAGKGTRLRPLTNSKPKPLVEVAGKPLLTHSLERLVSMGVDEIVVVIGYQGSKIVDHYGESFEGTPLTYASQEPRKGLAHATLVAEEHVEGPFVLTYADVLFEEDVSHCLDYHRETDPSATLLVTDVPREEAKRSGVIVTDEEDRVVRSVEKPDDPPTTLALPGLFVFDPVIFDACRVVTPSDRGEYELPDAFDLLTYAGHPVEYVETDGWRVNVNTPKDREQAEQYLIQQRSPTRSGTD